MTQTRGALQDRSSATSWSSSDHWLLQVGVNADPPPAPNEEALARYPDVVDATAANDRLPCPESRGLTHDLPGTASDDGGNILASAASVAARARCSARPVAEGIRERLQHRIDSAIVSGSATEVWQAAEAACSLGLDVHGLDEARERVARAQLLPSGGVTATADGLPDIPATYAYLRVRSIVTDGCSPGWWSGYP